MRAVIFDFGGVLVDWDPWRIYRDVFTTREAFDVFLAESRFFECLDRCDAGETFEAVMRDVDVYAAHHAPHVRAFAARQAEAIAGINPDVERIARDLDRLGVPLYGLTNWSAEMFPPTRARYDIFKIFRDIVVSGEEGLIKPDPRIFRRALERWGLAPAEALFIDDKIANVRAALDVGLAGVHFESAARLRAALSAHFPALGEQSCTSN